MKSNFWKDRRVFITGSTGLLGYWVTKYLAESGAKVTVLVRNKIPKPFQHTFSKVKVIHGTVLDHKLISKTLKKQEIQTVFHLAAQTISPVANKNPIPTFETNIQGTWILLEACRNTSGIENIIVASSDKAYGEDEALPFTEETRLTAKRPYTVSKSCADLLAQTYYASYGLPICITRCGNFFGGGDLLDRLVPTVIRAGLLEEPLLIRSDGKFIRDFLYVEDGVYATLNLAEAMVKKKKLVGQAFNFSYETPITILDLVNTILKRMDSKIKPKLLNQANNEIRVQYLSSQKARTLLKWKPRFAMEEGIDRTIKWYKEYFHQELQKK